MAVYTPNRNPSDTPEPEPSDSPRLSDREEVERQLLLAKQRAGLWLRRLWPVSAALVLLLWLGAGVYVVQPGEVGVIRTFGLETGRSGSGLYYRLPWPVQVVDVVNVQAIRRAEIGFRTEGDQVVRVNSEALMLTGDENIVDAHLIVQYRISDPSKYLFRLQDPDDALRAATEVAMRSAVGKMKIDDILTTGRGEVQERTRIFLQTLLDTYQSGLQITEVKLQVVDPPEQVKDSFQEVVRAREDRERLINESRAYREDILPKARGSAQETIRASEAYKQQRVIQANGDVANFVAVLDEYLKSKDVTRTRLYLEVVERVMARMDKIIMDPQASANTTPLLPLRPLQEGLSRQQAAGAAAQSAATAPAPAAQPAATAPQPAAPAKPAPAKP